MRPIDADALKKTFERWLEAKGYNEAERNIIRAAIIECQDAPTVQPDAPRVMKMAEEVFALRHDDVVYVEMYPSRAIVSAIVVDSIPWIKDELGLLQIRCIQEPLANMDFAWYGKTWRCWTGKPTKEQREAAKWDD